MYPLLATMILFAPIANVVASGSGEVGRVLLSPASNCTSDGLGWLNPEQSYGAPNIPKGSLAVAFTDSNSASSSSEGNLTCMGYDIGDRKVTNPSVGISLGISDSLDGGSIPETTEEAPELQVNSSPTLATPTEKIETVTTNIIEGQSTYDTSKAQLQYSTNGLDWVPLYDISASDVASSSGRLHVALPRAVPVDSAFSTRVVSFGTQSSQVLLVDSVFLVYEVGAGLEVEVSDLDGEVLVGNTEESSKKTLDIGTDGVGFIVKTKPDNTGFVSGFKGKVGGIFKDQKKDKNTNVNATVRGPSGDVIDSVAAEWISRDITNNDVWEVQIDAPQNFKPGRYVATFSATDKDGFSQSYDQDFTWGVLAMNSDKDVYKPNETALFEFGVLDDNGKMVCDAEVNLVIEGNGYSETKSTSSGEIVINDVCHLLEYTEIPDYETTWQVPGNTGEYELTLNAKTSNGEHTITKLIEVKNNPEVVISRHAPTRIYPPLSYPVVLSINSDQDFSGSIQEVVPAGFEVSELSAVEDIDGNVLSDEPSISVFGDKKFIKWQNVNITAGSEAKAMYTFDAPDVSPEFWLLGPIQISGSTEYEEARSWQIASDAIAIQNTSTPTVSAGVTAPTISLNVASGATMVVVGISVDTTPTISSVTDNNGDTYVAAIDAGASPRAAIYYSVNPTVNATKVITVTFSGAANSVIGAFSLTGTETTSPIVQAVSSTGTSTTPNTSITTTQANSLIVWTATDSDNGNFSGYGAGQIERYQGSQGGGSKMTGVSTSEITTTAGANNQTSSINKSAVWRAVAAEIKAAPTTISISGTSNSTGTVRVAVNGTLQAQTTTISTGAWTISGVPIPATGAVITTWVDGAAEADESTAVTKYSGSGNVTGMVLNRHILTIGSASGQSLTVTNLGQFDADTPVAEEDIIHTANTGVLNVTAGGHGDDSIRVLSGNTLTIGGAETLTTHDVMIDGTLVSSGAGTFTVTGSWDNNSVFTKGTETITFTSTTAETIDSTGASTSALHNVTLNGSGGTWTNNSAHTLSGNLVVTAGTLNGTNNFTVNGGGATGNGTINMTGGTFLLDGAGNFGGNTAWTFNNLTFGDGTGATTSTSTGTGNISVNGVLTIAVNQTLSLASKTWFLNGSGTPFVISGTFNSGTSTVEYNGLAATNIRTTTYNNLSFKPTAGSPTYTLLASTTTANGLVTIGNGTNAVTVTGATNNPTTNFSKLQINAAGTYTRGTGTLTLSGSGTAAARPLYINGGTYNGSSTGIIRFTGTAAIDIQNTTYGAIQFQPTSGSPVYTLMGGTITANSTVTVGNGTNAVTVQSNTNDPLVDINGSIIIATNATYSASDTSWLTVAINFTNNGTFTHNSGTVVFDTTATSTIAGNNTRFSGFSSTTNNKTIRFTSGQNFGFDGLISISGIVGNPIHIHSTTATSRWFIDYQGSSSITYAHIQDGGCQAGTQNLNLSTTTNTNDTNNDVCWFSTNTAPNVPTGLAQTKTDTSALSTGAWTNQSSVRFTANASDIDNPDSLQLCIEIDNLATAFSGTEDSCGSLVAYSGTAVAVTHTIGSLIDGTEYHWQARIKDAAGAYSAWFSYGANLESVRDVGVDISAPSGGAVYDGTTTDVDIDFNNGDLDNLSANWSGIDSTASGLSGYEYSIGTSIGSTDVVAWTSTGTTASVTATSLSLDTSNIYFFNVRTTDNAGNVSTVITSDGINIAPTLSFSSSPDNVVFDNLNSGNSYTSTKTTTLTTSTNAHNGYVIRAFVDGLLTSANSDTVGFFDGGTYAAPDAWQVGDFGYGYTSNDTLVQGTNIFSPATCAGGGSPPCYAPYSATAPGDIVADHTALVSGSPIVNENFIITHRVTTSSTQAAGVYTSEVTYVVNAIY